MKKRDEYIQSLHDSAEIMNDRIDRLQKELDETAIERDNAQHRMINEACKQPVIYRNGKYKQPRGKVERHWAIVAYAAENDEFRNLVLPAVEKSREINRLKRALKIINNTLKALGGEHKHE